MDTPEKMKRLWWRKKRWCAALAMLMLWPICYAASLGPAYYCHARGWVSLDVMLAVYRPLLWGQTYAGWGAPPWWPNWYADYVTRCYEVGELDYLSRLPDINPE